MRLVITTDMEGCAGMINSTDWCLFGSKYYDAGKSLLTQEVNAAIRGFIENGFDEILVLDAHGPGGIDLLQLDERVLYQRGFEGPYPIGLTKEFDAMAWVGQHAKASTPYAHLAHTSSMDVLDQRINGISVGEFGMGVFMGATMGIKPIYGSGDKAFCNEAKALCPHIYTTCVKEGVISGTGAECLTEEYRARNAAAIHLHPSVARRKIYEDACAAAKAFLADPDQFTIQPLAPPITVEIDYRTNARNTYAHKAYHHDSDLIAALNMSWADR